MHPTNLDSSDDDDGNELRRSIHDLSAAIIYVRALAETLAEHVPILVSISRLRYPAIESQIPAKTLDVLPSIPTEIIELCEAAREALRAIGDGRGSAENASIASDERFRSDRPDASTNQCIGKGGKILVVEDEAMARFILSQTLETKGCRVISVSDGEAALKLLDEQDFDLILMDLRIPGLSGCETAQRIRQRQSAQGRFTRIIGLTASPLLEDQRRAKAAGMDDVLVKPIDGAALQSLLAGIS